MHRQTLAQSEKVLGHEHPNALTSVHCLARLFAHRHRYHEALTLYDRASAGDQAVLGQDHPTTRACRQHHADALASQDRASHLSYCPSVDVTEVGRQMSQGAK
ncbi:hypothetical protein BDV95DRAFT_578477 [Massariosphaeria phaeospora]|uniref:Tetratricopeptide repeat-domain-containing protein n=1 Tax=Massariosphaeria phaeospora TaxID=100035 RepID=A0A7C8M5F5_9PLEO|nr:hypothetical protein BDV95DRAFT_578477 [Massariosphaeria phaeospora]